MRVSPRSKMTALMGIMDHITGSRWYRTDRSTWTLMVKGIAQQSSRTTRSATDRIPAPRHSVHEMRGGMQRAEPAGDGNDAEPEHDLVDTAADQRAERRWLAVGRWHREPRGQHIAV